MVDILFVGSVVIALTLVVGVIWLALKLFGPTDTGADLVPVLGEHSPAKTKE